jgi:PrgI family protein
VTRKREDVVDVDSEIRARIPADIEAPDALVFGLTARQAAIVATAAAASYLIWHTLGTRLPLPAVAVLLIPIAAAAVVLALGRRDGLGLDAWLLAALRHRRAPRRAAPAPEPTPPVPTWAPAAAERDAAAAAAGPAVLRLPAHAIDDDGVIDLGGSAAVLVGATTVNIGLRTGAEQAALIGGFARWLNALTGPVQIVVSAQRVDLTSHALRVADAAQTLPHPALADAALDYAEFLAEVAERRDPLWRTVTIACAAPGTGTRQAGVEATRRAEHTVAALAALGAQTRVLDGPTAAAVLTAAVDPYQPPTPAGRGHCPTPPSSARP